ncbi:MAG TPA: thioredoxin family protein [Holophagaceae bacterium]|nr:thioredoxin family protein [Holophagaceae bacterium]
MALLESTMVPLGSPCPAFRLPGVDGRDWGLEDFRTPLLLVVVMCNHCPYVQAVDDRINALAKAFEGRCAVVGINPNDAVAYPDDSFDAMRERAAAKGFVFPYLRDEAQAVARRFGAVCTPDFFLYDADRRLRYRGRLDDHWKDPAAVKHQELKAAIEALLAGSEPDPVQRPSMGCSIKWRPA